MYQRRRAQRRQRHVNGINRVIRQGNRQRRGRAAWNNMVVNLVNLPPQIIDDDNPFAEDRTV
ncbi:2697_t:CDS:2 [Funneliformis caledonium]|uniref:2697_t:CDS:1 n=1 Tax=Funneliformis caledonium TaxID=1117310 RepID=A0A9N8V974_9GLOM|nr:2697_t:CDS:2 [Funneliformis caledonium]